MTLWDFRRANKLVRKKTTEELRLLEYFLEQDPEWNRSTVSTAAKLLGLSCYQVYKWGYDRKNRKDARRERFFVRNIEVDKEMIQKINELKQETKYKTEINLNQKVDQLLIGSSKYKNLDENWAEFPINELNFLNNAEGESSIKDISKTTQKPSAIQHSKVFKIQKVHKRFKQNEDDYENGQNDVIWQGWSGPNASNLLNLNQDIKSNILRNKDNEAKIYEGEANDRQSDITNDKSNASVIIKNDFCDKLSHMYDVTPFGR